jgi:UDPglucose--hexose-1-phosphate uridylyltransferase
MFKRVLQKPDGRLLLLYSATALPPELEAPSPPGASRTGGHLRWHPLRGEWVAYAAHRQNRTFLPPPEYNPLAPTTDPSSPTELPAGEYDVAVFENLFPTFSMAASRKPPHALLPTAPGLGACEVVVFTQDATATLGGLPLWHLRLLFDVWADRTEALGSLPEVHYVMPFENRGVEVGVTLQHPHGQIYAYPFVPPVAARELQCQREYLDANGTGLLQDLLAAELDDGRRVLLADEHVLAFVPACARFPFEVWIAPRRPVALLQELRPTERASMARALKTVLLTYDRMWSRPFPYVMVFHQAPTDGEPHPEAHLHIEFYPAYRLPDRLKYLAGSELGAGVFTADAEPEAVAAQLRAAQERLG